MTTAPRSLLVTGALGAALLLAGCTPGAATHSVKGKITYKGEPMQVKPMVGKLRVWFVQQDVPPPGPDFKYAVVQPDGSFSVPGSDGRGLEAGKYKICVVWQDDFPKGPDKLEKKFDEKHSRIYRTVPTDQEVVLDVSRPEG